VRPNGEGLRLNRQPTDHEGAAGGLRRGLTERHEAVGAGVNGAPPRLVLLGAEDVDAPDLQTLVAKCGGYNKISEAEWREYDRAIAAWQARRREKFKRR
jgi:hypothetical protein